MKMNFDMSKLMEAFCRVKTSAGIEESLSPFYEAGYVRGNEFCERFQLIANPKKDTGEVSIALGSIWFWDGQRWRLDTKFHGSIPLTKQVFSRGQIVKVAFAEYREYRWATLQWGGPTTTERYQPTLLVGGVSTRYVRADKLFIALDMFAPKCRWGKRVWVCFSRGRLQPYDVSFSFDRPRELPKMLKAEKESMVRVDFSVWRMKRVLMLILAGFVAVGAFANWFNTCLEFLEKVIDLILMKKFS